MDEEEERLLAKLEVQWRVYLSRFPGELPSEEAISTYRAMFPFGSPEQFDLLWRNAKAKIAREIAARALPLLEAVPEPTRPTPPRAGEMLVGLLCKRDIREAVLGDLDEKFAELAERRGAGVAKAWYWSQAARSVLFFAVRWGRRLLALEAILKRIL